MQPVALPASGCDETVFVCNNRCIEFCLFHLRSIWFRSLNAWGREQQQKIVWLSLLDDGRRGVQVLVMIQPATSKSKACIEGELGYSLETVESSRGWGRRGYKVREEENARHSAPPYAAVLIDPWCTRHRAGCPCTHMVTASPSVLRLVL